MSPKSILTLAAATAALAVVPASSAAAPVCNTTSASDRESVTVCADPVGPSVSVEFCLDWSFDCQYLIRPT